MANNDLQLRTLLIGIDGATFSVLDPLMQSGVMPFLKNFIAGGVHAELQSVIPPLTPPAWTSLMTGLSPAKHGIFDFFRKVSADSHHFTFTTSQDLEVETIWSLANRHGRRTTVLNFPLMFPPPTLDGHSIPGWMPWKQLRLGCHPSDLYDRLKTYPWFNTRELAMDMETEAKAVEGCDPAEFEAWIALHIRRERQWLRILEMLMMEDDPSELTAVLFDGVDKLQHLFWSLLDPAATEEKLAPQDKHIRQCCLDYFRELDRILARLVELAGDNATIVMASDHGFGPQRGTFFVNRWLEQEGYLAWAGEAPMASETAELGMGHLTRHVYLLD